MGAAVVAVGVVLAVIVRLQRAPAVVADDCAGDAFAATWPGAGGRARDAVDAALAPRPTIRDTALASLDGYADRWRKRWRAACQDGRRDAAAFHEIAACLYDGRAQTAALARELTTPGDALLEDAVAAVEDLPSPARCVAGDAPARPTDPALAAQVRAVEAQLARARALASASSSLALPAAHLALAQALATQHRPLIAAARLQLGNVLSDAGDAAVARRALGEAVLAAEEAGRAELRARALIALVGLEIAYSSDVDVIDRVARQATAAVERGSIEPALRAQLASTLAHVAWRAGDLAGALAQFDRATALQMEAEGSTSELAWLDLSRARVLIALGEPAQALAVLDPAHTSLAAALGSDHATVRELWFQSAVALHGLGRDEEAHARLDELRALHPPPPVPDGPVPLSGVIRDGAGQPIGGVDVTLSPIRLHGDTFAAVQPFLPDRLAAARVREVVTDADGRFVAHVDPGPLQVLAEHGQRGRAVPRWVTIDAEHPPRALALTLAPWVQLRGRVRGAVPPLSHVHVIPAGVEDYQLEVPLIGDTFSARVGAGPQQVELLHNDSWVRGFFARTTVDARADAAASTADVELVVTGTVTVTVEIRLAGDLPLPGGFVAILPGKMSPLPERMDALMPAFEKTAQRGLAHGSAIQIRDGRGTVVLGPMAPGPHTLCAAALAGDLRDPSIAARLLAHADQVGGRCQHIDVPAAPAAQTLTIEVPPPTRVPD